ncbi:hypothetical protein B9Z19DRAFT_1156122 [Tuber borchii]|uniref:Uncharacterized protein n=1 Tax=Tuber borchii TaxID=42251 RepID=A0A2T6ZHD0_TUBBO|nr:hypothetical protein B9Z19DRAFT_1156122 [Tuber borchii]
MSTQTETRSTIAKMLVTVLLIIILLLMTNPVLTFMIGYPTALIPQAISPEKLISYRIDILFWGSVIIGSSYMKPYYDKLIKLFESVGASLATWEFTYEPLALSEQGMSEIGSLPGPLISTGPGPETPAASITVSMESCTPGFTTEEAPSSSGEHSPSSPSTRSEETTKCPSPNTKQRLPREKISLDKTANTDSSHAGAPQTLPLTVIPSLRWHSQGKYLDGTPIPPRRKQNIYTVELPTAPKKATTPSQGRRKTTATSEKNKERGSGEELDISDLLSPKSNPPLISTPSQYTPGRQGTLPAKHSPLQAESFTLPPSLAHPPTRRRLLHKCIEQLIPSHNQNSVSSPDPSPNANKGTFPEDEDIVMQEVSSLGSRYISNAMDSWGTTREPIKKERMVVAVSTSWSEDQKGSFYERDFLDGVSEEDVLRITSLWAAGLLEVCERKLAEVILK